MGILTGLFGGRKRLPTVFILNDVPAHHLDLDFYGRFFKPGAYLRSHAEHMQRWHDWPEER